MRTLLAALLLAAAPLAAVAEIADSATDIRPILNGTTAPDAPLRTFDGGGTSVHQLLDGRPTVLVFYRGGWCPYCNLQLSGLRTIEMDLVEMGYQLVALSADSPESIRRTLDRAEFGYTLASDASGKAAQAYGIAFRVDDETYEKYKAYGIDLEADSGFEHHALPVPAVFVIDSAGVVQFGYVHPDYTIRTPAKVVLEAARAIQANEHRLAR